ncbi:MAG: YheT family hydrolase [Burkholderiales bacterium]
MPSTHEYRAPWWLPGGHAQTIYTSVFAPRPPVHYRRERWDTPDGDFIDLDWVEGRDSGLGIGDSKASTPVVVLFHGLEGSSNSHYARSIMQAVLARGWRGVVVHFRGCSGEANRLPRAYHSGDSTEGSWILARLRTLAGAAPLFAAGVSLGGNMLLRWLGEHGASAGRTVTACAAVSAPVDLTAAGDALALGFNRVYTANFLGTMKRKTLAKRERYPDLVDWARMGAANTLRLFDDVVTAPLHGFRDVDDYWTRASAKPVLGGIRVPTLMLNALNDPFLPARALPSPQAVSPQVRLEYPPEGGHVGFTTDAPPWRPHWLPHRLLTFFDEQMTTASRN